MSRISIVLAASLETIDAVVPEGYRLLRTTVRAYLKVRTDVDPILGPIEGLDTDIAGVIGLAIADD